MPLPGSKHCQGKHAVWRVRLGDLLWGGGEAMGWAAVGPSSATFQTQLPGAHCPLGHQFLSHRTQVFRAQALQQDSHPRFQSQLCHPPPTLGT